MSDIQLAAEAYIVGYIPGKEEGRVELLLNAYRVMLEI